MNDILDLEYLLEGNQLFNIQKNDFPAPKVQAQGNNARGVILLYKNTNGAPLNDTEQEMVAKMTAAIGLQPNDYALVHEADLQLSSIAELDEQLPFSKLLVFGEVPFPFALKLDVPMYTPLTVCGKTVLLAEPLDLMATPQGVNAKKRLWGSLQHLFNLKST